MGAHTLHPLGDVRVTFENMLTGETVSLIVTPDQHLILCGSMVEKFEEYFDPILRRTWVGIRRRKEYE